MKMIAVICDSREVFKQRMKLIPHTVVFAGKHMWAYNPDQKVKHFLFQNPMYFLDKVKVYDELLLWGTAPQGFTPEIIQIIREKSLK